MAAPLTRRLPEAGEHLPPSVHRFLLFSTPGPAIIDIEMIDWLRRVCLSFPQATEQVQWGNDLVFKIGGKMFAVVPLEPAAVHVSFKCSPEDFVELTERPDVIPAPYLARAHWVALEREGAIPRAELEAKLKSSYELVLAKLPAKTRADLQQTGTKPRRKAAAKATRRGSV